VQRRQPQAAARAITLAYYFILQINYGGGQIGNAILHQLAEGGLSLRSLSSTTQEGYNKLTAYVSFHLNES